MKYALTNCQVFTGEKNLYNQSVLIENEHIKGIVHDNQIPVDFEIVDLHGLNIAPGFIDLQVNGGGGEFFTQSPNTGCLDAMYNAYKRYGTTHICPTVITTHEENILETLDATKTAMREKKWGILGMHLEGPFINSSKKGTHNPNNIRKGTIQELERILNNAEEALKIITIAPELFGDKELALLKESSTIVSAGHTFANYNQAMYGFNNGVTMVTHLFNAMSQFSSREPGVVGATFDSENVHAGIIVDGLHCDYSSVRTAKKVLGEKLFLVSDSMSFVGAKTNKLIIEGTEITFKDGRCINSNGDFAGTSLTMLDAVQNAVNYVGIELKEALRMASLYPAQSIGMENELGRIKEGYRADLVVFDNKISVKGVMSYGNLEMFSSK
jgi:N-acetylglucosamine-6-phosphate deacetylase